MFWKTFILVVLGMLMIESGAGAAGSARAASTRQANHNANGCTPAQGQLLIEQGQYADAIVVFTCLIDAQPTEVEGYRGRIEAEVLLGRYSDGVRDYQCVMAFRLFTRTLRPQLCLGTTPDSRAHRTISGRLPVRALRVGGSTIMRLQFICLIIFSISDRMTYTATCSAARAASCSTDQSQGCGGP